eukprot:15457041-Alexandrium_andersonii.AAC.1
MAGGLPTCQAQSSVQRSVAETTRSNMQGDGRPCPCWLYDVVSRGLHGHQQGCEDDDDGDGGVKW